MLSLLGSVLLVNLIYLLFFASGSDVVAHLQTGNLCPASSVLNIQNQNKDRSSAAFTGNFIYPIDIYAKSQMKNLQ